VSGQFFYDGQPDLSRSYPEAFGNMASHRTGVFNTIFGPMTSAVPVSADYDVPVRANSVHAALTAGRLQASLFSSSVRTSNTPAYTPDNAVYNDIAFALNRLLVGSIAYTANIGRARTTTTLSASRHELDPDSGYLNVYSNLQRSYKYAYGSRVRAEHQATWSATPNLRLTAGGEYERMFSIPQTADLNAPLVDHNTPGTILGTTIVDELYRVRYSNLAGYVQAQWDVHPRARLTGGLRADYNSRYDAVVNPRVGLVSRLTQSTTGKLLYGSAYLAPSPYQSFLHYGAFYSTDDGATYQSDFWHVPNPDLKPQRKRTFEAQVQQALGRNLNVGLSAFYSRFTDLVFESDVTSRESGRYLGWPVAFIQQSINGGREATYGGTLSVEYLNVFEPRRQLRVRGALSHADGRVDEVTAPGGRIESGAIAPLMLQATLDLDWDQWSVAPRVIAVSRQRALALDMANDGPWRRRTIDGYATVDVTIRRTGVGPLDLFVRVDNLFDARYRNVNLRAFTNPEEMEGSPQNPRRLSAGVQIRLK
jgi:iron complex outermembrane receptor protein